MARKKSVIITFAIAHARGTARRISATVEISHRRVRRLIADDRLILQRRNARYNQKATIASARAYVSVVYITYYMYIFSCLLDTNIAVRAQHRARR